MIKLISKLRFLLFGYSGVHCSIKKISFLRVFRALRHCGLDPQSPLIYCGLRVKPAMTNWMSYSLTARKNQRYPRHPRSKMTFKTAPFLFLFLFVCHVHGQKLDTIFRQPLELPALLSGNFAELRDNHFHSGLDFRTQGVTGQKVYACEQGYVSRISVSPVGYGNALYITHPNGYTTVYAHLEAFNDEITAYVKQQQYRQEQFAVNLFPDAGLFPVKRGDVIAFSGNSGGSGGPHLHFEVRDAKTEEPVNPLLFGFGVKDNIPPVMRRLAVFPIGEGSKVNGSTEKLILNLEKSGKRYRIVGGKKLTVVGKVAFGIDAYDLTSGSANRLGTYGIQLGIDSVLMFSQIMNRFSFDESRYVNSLIDYGYYVNHRVRLNRLYIEPNNRLSVYDRHINRGVVSFPDSANHNGWVVVRDFHGNSSRLEFSFAYIPDKTLQTPLFPNVLETFPFSGKTEGMCRNELIHAGQGIRVVIPANALYDDIVFSCTASTIPKGLYSKAYKIHYPSTPLHKAMTVEIAADSLPERLREKALLVRIDANGKRSSAGGAYRDGAVIAASTVFGEFAIGVDTVAPRIAPINIKNGVNLRGVKNMRFKITDNFSGVNSYNGWIDGLWALFEYDAKNDLLYYNFDADRLTKTTQHTLELKITDGKGNTAEYKSKFTW